MASIKLLKDKISSITSIMQTTNAMRLVSSVQMTKSMKGLREYGELYNSVREIVKDVSSSKDFETDQKTSGKVWIVFTTDRGFVGAYNIDMMKLIRKNVGPNDKLILIGTKGQKLLSKYTDVKPYREYELKDLNRQSIIDKLKIRIIHEFQDKNFEVNVIYTKFINQLISKPEITKLLPFEKTENKNSDELRINFEPDLKTVMKDILSIYISTTVVYLKKEVDASEVSTRRNMMENATNNGKDMIKEYNSLYNKLRQAKVTQEITEISAAQEAMK